LKPKNALESMPLNQSVQISYKQLIQHIFKKFEKPKNSQYKIWQI